MPTRARILILIAVPLLGSIVLSGCRSNQAVDLLESELRWLEDQLYEIEYQNEILEAQLESLKEENERLRRARANGNGSSGRSAAERLFGNRSGSPDDREPAGGPSISPPGDSGSREIPRGDDGRPGGNLEDDLRIPDVVIPGLDRDARNRRRAEAQYAASRVDRVDARATKLVIDRRRTQGANLDGRPGDDTIRLIVAPVNRTGQFVPLPGPITVVALDPTRRGAEARVGRWEFDTAQVEKQLRSSALEQGIELELRWPHGQAPAPVVRLYVRYHTVDGRKLEAQHELGLDSPEHVSSRWTPHAQPTFVRPDDQVRQAAHSEAGFESFSSRPPMANRQADEPQGANHSVEEPLGPDTPLSEIELVPPG